MSDIVSVRNQLAGFTVAQLSQFFKTAAGSGQKMDQAEFKKFLESIFTVDQLPSDESIQTIFNVLLVASGGGTEISFTGLKKFLEDGGSSFDPNLFSASDYQSILNAVNEINELLSKKVEELKSDGATTGGDQMSRAIQVNAELSLLSSALQLLLNIFSEVKQANTSVARAGN